MTEVIKIRVPASTSNLGPGFDTLSLALSWYNEFTFKVVDKGLKIHKTNFNALPVDSSNLVYKSFLEFYKKQRENPPGLELEINSSIPLAAGLGSSATAIVSGLLAANQLTGNKMSKEELVSLASVLEGHPDNVAAALYGGLTISFSEDEMVKVNKFPWPSELLIIIVVPNFDLPTNISRELLPAKVPYGDATFNISCTAFLLSSLISKNWEGLKHSFQDRLHQPYRKDLIPGMDVVLNEALINGALGSTLSGAGPTLAAFSNDQSNAQKIGKAMVNKWSEFKVKSEFKVLSVANEGASVEVLVTK